MSFFSNRVPWFVLRKCGAAWPPINLAIKLLFKLSIDYWRGSCSTFLGKLKTKLSY